MTHAGYLDRELRIICFVRLLKNESAHRLDILEQQLPDEWKTAIRRERLRRTIFDIHQRRKA